MTLDVTHHLAELARAHDVPGAVLGVLDGDEVTTIAAGFAPDTAFEIGSITKSYTATAAVRLAAQGGLDLDAPVRDVLPGFAVADPEVSARVTPRHLLAHTSGIAGDCFLDTGPGEDCLERYVEACADLGQDAPFGATMSYCNTGYCILGRIIEVVTAETWEAAMHELVPVGAASAERPRAQPSADLPRSMGPAGGIWASAADVLAFVRTHLHDGAAAAMQRPQVDVPDRWSTGPQWGLGWILDEWDGRRVFGHDGNTGAQSARMRIVPDAGVAAVLLTTGGDTNALWRALWDDVVRERAGVAMPPSPAPARGDPLAGADAIVGRYERHGFRIDVEVVDGGVTARSAIIEPLASQVPAEERAPSHARIRPSSAGDGVFVAQPEGTDAWTPMVVFELAGERYLHTEARAHRRVA